MRWKILDLKSKQKFLWRDQHWYESRGEKRKLIKSDLGGHSKNHFSQKMDRMNFYKCNLIFIGLVRVQQGLTYSFHKRLESFFGHQILWEYLTFWSLLFLFSENNIKRTFFIQDLECGTIESDIFLACLEYTFLLFFRNNTLEGCSIVFQDTIVVQSHHHHLEKKNAKRKRLRTLHLKKKIVVIKSPTTIAVASEQTLAQCLKITQNVAFEF